jgi:hypothetical protein
MEQADNGKFLTQLRYPFRAGMATTAVVAGRDWATFTRPYTAPFWSFAKPLSTAVAAGQLVFEGSEEVAGVATYRVVLPPDPETYRKVRAWFAPQYGFNPVKLELFYDGDGRKAEQRESLQVFSNFSEVSPGIWYPLESWTYWVDFNPPEACHSRITSVKINTNLPDRQFTVTFPAGTHVQDELKGTKHVVSDPVEQSDKIGK